MGRRKDITRLQNYLWYLITSNEARNAAVEELSKTVMLSE